MIVSAAMATRTTRMCAGATYAITLTGAGIRGQHRGRVPDRMYQYIRSRKTSTCSRSKEDGKDSSDGPESPKFSWKQVFLQWALGVYVSTPLIAILQGSLLLNDYRVNHSNAPRPVMPARGVAVAIDEERTESLSSWILHQFSSSPNHPPSHERPLRLLVVGDSLAAGVGMSKSGVPILPESIARALSKEMGGRAVYWTCVGTPGVSATQLVKDIEEIEPYDPHPKGRQLERIVKEFQNRRRRWLERREHKDNQDTDTAKLDSEENERKQGQQEVQWWKRIRRKGTSDSVEIHNNPRGIIVEWWNNIRNAFRQRRQLVEEDISAIKHIFLKPLPQLDDDNDDYYYDYYRENLPSEDTTTNEKCNVSGVKLFNEDDSHRKNERLPLIHKGSLFRKTSVIPKAAAEYDIAIVLTGLNDVKEAFMPHMNSGSGHGPARLENRLRQVLEALKEKMSGNMDLEENHDRNNRDHHQLTETFSPDDGLQKPSNIQESNQPKTIKHPLVVVPELPVAPLRLFRLVPLCWFLIPIFRAMENNKRFLASCFPDNVVFVHQPDLDWWTDDEMGIGSIRENIKNEKLLLRVTDSVRSGRERIEELMKNHYGSKEEEMASKERISKSNQQPPCSTSSRTEDKNKACATNKEKILEGSDFVSVDGIHPNDEGYELWGRHIASAIIYHLKKKR